jgi:hypothetical protein
MTVELRSFVTATIFGTACCAEYCIHEDVHFCTTVYGIDRNLPWLKEMAGGVKKKN